VSLIHLISILEEPVAMTAGGSQWLGWAEPGPGPGLCTDLGSHPCCLLTCVFS
jgi:hypothetical protein